MCLDACMCMYVCRLLCSADPSIQSPCGGSPAEMTSPSLPHECGVRQGCSHCRCSPSPRSLRSAAAPPVPRWPWLEFQPLQGAEQLWMSIPLEGGKGAATLPQQHKPTWCRLGPEPSVRKAHILFSVSVSKAEPELAAVLHWELFAAHSTGHRERSPRSKTALKMQCVS